MSIGRGKLHSCQGKLSQKAFGPLFISTYVSRLSLNNKGGVFSNAMRKGFTDPQRGLKVNEFDEEVMFIEPEQFSDPAGAFRILLLQVYRILVHPSLMELLVKARFTEEGFTVGSVVKMGNRISHNFQLYWPHFFLLFLYKNILKE